MDPDAALRIIDESEDPATIAEHCDALRDWLRRGGYEPRWSRYHKGTARYAARTVRSLRGEEITR